ncbi:MAG TPA: hypothetical protein VK195_02855, partial [Burkholderiaceae bacterium]|nr:hypothetical protein [Burkholderiaceae bacterium]
AVMSLPEDLAGMQTLLGLWQSEGRGAQDLTPAVLGGSYARAAYRAQLLPLLGDPQAQHLQGATGDMARQPWRVRWSVEQGEVEDEFVKWMSRGHLLPVDEAGQVMLPPELAAHAAEPTDPNAAQKAAPSAAPTAASES